MVGMCEPLENGSEVGTAGASNLGEASKMRGLVFEGRCVSDRFGSLGVVMVVGREE